VRLPPHLQQAACAAWDTLERMARERRASERVSAPPRAQPPPRSVKVENESPPQHHIKLESSPQHQYHVKMES
jgi:hypothetical protein